MSRRPLTTDPSDRKLPIGVAGLGRAFSVMLPTFAADPRVALVAAADPRAEARARFAADFAGKAYARVEELCADPAVEIVYVATPHQLHARHAILAAEHGKHVLVQKPMAVDLETAARMIAIAQGAGIQLGVISQHRFDDAVLFLKRALASAPGCTGDAFACVPARAAKVAFTLASPSRISQRPRIITPRSSAYSSPASIISATLGLRRMLTTFCAFPYEVM